MKAAFALAAALACLAAGAGHAQPGPLAEAGAIYEISSVRKSTEKTNRLSSGYSSDHNGVVERIVAVRADGIELEYDRSGDLGPDERERVWYFPFRVFRPNTGAARLLDAGALETRIAAWLKRWNIPREQCERWFVTWTTFQIDCDPKSALEIFRRYDLRSLDRGAGPWRASLAATPARFKRKKAGRDGETLSARMAIDPDAVRRELAEADVALAEMMQKPISLDEAIRVRAQDRISGTIDVVVRRDGQGRARRMTSVTKMRIERPDGLVEIRRAKEALERRRLGRPTPPAPTR